MRETENHKLLTIAIPTFNRHELLKEQIEALLPQMSDQIKVVILDNHSEPAVSSYLGELCGNQIEIIRNRENIGGDANIYRCFEYCETEWLWVLSDDDLVKDDAVLRVLEEIAHHRDSVFINFQTGRDYATIGLEGFCKSKPHYAAAFAISLCIYNVFKLRPWLANYYCYLSSCQGHLILVLKYLENNKEGICSFFKYTPISRAIPPQWSRIYFIERMPTIFSAFNDKSLALVKEAFAGCMIYILLRFINQLRMNEGLSRKLQCSLFINTISHINLETLFARNNAKQFLVFIVCFCHTKAAVKLLQAYRTIKSNR
jgi:glycosyltransferase involved in cell wall biosynthesis